MNFSSVKVVICLKICTFVVSKTTQQRKGFHTEQL